MRDLFPVFCIKDISPEILKKMSDEINDYLYDHSELGDEDAEERLYVLTTKDITTVGSDKDTSWPTEPFQSPFRDASVEEVQKWFTENLAQHGDFVKNTMIILDAQTIKDHTCLLICIRDKYQPPETLRYDFYNVLFGGLMFVYQTWAREWYWEEDEFRRSKVALTNGSRERHRWNLLSTDGALEVFDDVDDIENWPREEKY